MSAWGWMRNGPPLMPRRIAVRTVETLRQEGWRSLLFMVLADLGYRRLLLLERVLSEERPFLYAQAPLEFSQLEWDELDEYVAFHDEDPRSQLEGRLARGEECFIARSGGRIVCANWAVYDEHTVRFLRYPLRIGPGEVYVYDSYTLPAFRGSGAAPALAAHLIERFLGAGLERALTLVLPENATNLRVRAKTGYRVCGRIACLKLGPRIWHFHRDEGSPNPSLAGQTR